jgi:glycosyltransferase involved in cell wall biosynthesis
MSEPPLVSIVMAVKDGDRFIGQALDSIQAQTWSRHETVVVDGGSIDRSVEIAEGYPGVRVISQAGTGFWGAWNEGIAVARGSLIAILDSDDLWEPRKLERQVEVLQSRPEVDYVITRMSFFLEPGHPCPAPFKAQLLEGDHLGNLPSALLARRELFDSVGMFSTTDYTIASDIDWFARAKDSDAVLAVVPELLVRKRVHDLNVSNVQARDLNRQVVSLLRDSLTRQRAPSR